MNKNPMSKKFRSRMVRSGVLASAGYGLLFGACAEFVAALTCWTSGRYGCRFQWDSVLHWWQALLPFLSGFARMTAGLPIAWTAWDWRNGRSR